MCTTMHTTWTSIAWRSAPRATSPAPVLDSPCARSSTTSRVGDYTDGWVDFYLIGGASSLLACLVGVALGRRLNTRSYQSSATALARNDACGPDVWVGRTGAAPRAREHTPARSRRPSDDAKRGWRGQDPLTPRLAERRDQSHITFRDRRGGLKASARSHGDDTGFYCDLAQKPVAS